MSPHLRLVLRRLVLRLRERRADGLDHRLRRSFCLGEESTLLYVLSHTTPYKTAYK